ncbi:MAG TPA: hypothetical protein VIW68_05650 [Candidatus Sulfotelmatobacter sp.]
MQSISRFFSFFSVLVIAVLASVMLFIPALQAQDEPSLGDAARQARQQKQQRDASAKEDPSGDTQGQNTPSPGSQNKDVQNKDGANRGSPSKDAQAKDSQAKDGQSKNAQLHKASHVITNDELPSHAVAVVKAATAPSSRGEHAPDPAFGGKMSADEVKQGIQDQKDGIAALESQIKEVNDSIHFAGGNCVENCAQWNQEQQQKQRQVEDMRSVLENAKQALEQMQDYARRMGYGSSVYDPE